MMSRLDELKQQVSFEQVARYYGTLLPELKRSGDEIRTSCFLNCGKAHPTGDRAIAINTATADSRWKCHHYGCAHQGDLVTMCHLLKPGFDSSGNPKGDRFKAILSDLEAIAGGTVHPGGGFQSGAPAATKAPPAVPEVNVLLKDSENERARALVDLDQKFIVEPDDMAAQAASYFRHRPWLTSDVARQWRMGYLPKDTGGDRSGGTMRGKIVYPLLDCSGDVLTWFGRDPVFEQSHAKWLQSGRAGPEPIKTRFVKGFQRGLELFGQHQDWQQFRNEGWREHGLFVVEGPNDVMRLAQANVPSVGLCSNQGTDIQTDRIVGIAHEHFSGLLTVALDNDTEGHAGARDLTWKLLQRGVGVQLLWTRNDTEFIDRQPESLTDEELDTIHARVVS